MKSIERTTRDEDANRKGPGKPTEATVDGEEDEVDAQMKAMLGFGGFGTTKEKKVAGNDVYSVRKEKKTEYRQYMLVAIYGLAEYRSC